MWLPGLLAEPGMPPDDEPLRDDEPSPSPRAPDSVSDRGDMDTVRREWWRGDESEPDPSTVLPSAPVSLDDARLRTATDAADERRRRAARASANRSAASSPNGSDVRRSRSAASIWYCWLGGDIDMDAVCSEASNGSLGARRSELWRSILLGPRCRGDSTTECRFVRPTIRCRPGSATSVGSTTAATSAAAGSDSTMAGDSTDAPAPAVPVVVVVVVVVVAPLPDAPEPPGATPPMELPLFEWRPRRERDDDTFIGAGSNGLRCSVALR
mmetsp:Transcript_3210/g.10564  ORF Transcript_3210/g.10564 Transcript_3210/m.10564 type:complete len:269 (-) Transcript_3210:2530-3336(-)